LIDIDITVVTVMKMPWKLCK